MFEVITQTQPDDYQSLEILKEGYRKIGRLDESFRVSRRLAEAYYNVGSYTLALQECEVILLKEPNAPEILALQGEIEHKLQQTGTKSPDAGARTGLIATDLVAGSEWRVVDRDAGDETQPDASVAGTGRRSAGEIFDRATALPGRRDHGCARNG